jgi:amphi-Trp domain-containing protein
MSGNAKLSYDATTSANQVADYLTTIADGLRAGTIGLSSSGRSVILHPSDVVKLEIVAEGKPDDGRGRLALAISWKRRARPETPPLEISTSPEIEEPAEEAAAATSVEVAAAE